MPQNTDAGPHLLAVYSEAESGPRLLAHLSLIVFLMSLLLLISCFALCVVANASSRRGADAAVIVVPRPSSAAAAETWLVIGFMGGRVHADNLLHPEALLGKEIQQEYPRTVHAFVFANHDGAFAFRMVLHSLDANQDGTLSANERKAARIVIYGHSWGASEALTLADRLNAVGIPVLLTAQVDSVRKIGENDSVVPPNVMQAINFYQSEGLLHGQAVIHAADPERTTFLGNYRSTYRTRPIACLGYPWFARLFMRKHIEIENDPRVWQQIRVRIEDLLADRTAPPAAVNP